MTNILAEQISDRITVPDILNRYGYPTNARRRIPCPLHNGKDSNFCYTNQVFHCWTCGEKGNAIGLAMKLHNITFAQALLKLNMDFHLGLTSNKPTLRERRQFAEDKKISKIFAEIEAENQAYYRGLSVFHRSLWEKNSRAEINDFELGIMQDVERWLDDNLDKVVAPWC